MSGRDERGSALVEVMWLAVLLLVPLVYLLVTALDVQRAAYGTTTASRAAGRAFVLAPDETVARERARLAAGLALDDQGVDDFDLEIACTPDPGACLTPGSTVTVTVLVDQALPLAPAFLGSQAPSVQVDATHAEPYGTFRVPRS